MEGSSADLHVCEIRRQVWIRRAFRLLHYDRYRPLSGRSIAELTVCVVPPGVGVAVAAHSQGKTRAVAFCSADLVEFDAADAGWRGDGGGLVAQLATLIGIDLPRVVGVFARPLGGQGQILGDGPAEIVGDLVDEPSVEQIAFARRVGGGALHPAV